MPNPAANLTEPRFNPYHIVIMILTIVTPIIVLPYVIDNAFNTPKTLALLTGASLMVCIYCFNYLTGRPTIKQTQPTQIGRAHV